MLCLYAFDKGSIFWHVPCGILTSNFFGRFVSPVISDTFLAFGPKVEVAVLKEIAIKH